MTIINHIEISAFSCAMQIFAEKIGLDIIYNAFREKYLYKKFFPKWCIFCLFFWCSFILLRKEAFGYDVYISLGNSFISCFLYALYLKIYSYYYEGD